MIFQHHELPEPLRVRNTRTLLPWLVTERGRPIAAFETEARARAYASRLNQIMEKRA